MDPTLQELLDRLSELTDTELGELLSQLLDAFEDSASEEPTDESLELMGALADAIDQARAEETSRAEAADERQRAADELATRVRGQLSDGTEDAEDADADAVDEDEGEEDAADDTADEGAGEPVLAGAGNAPLSAPPPPAAITRLAPRRPRAHAPRPAESPSLVTITAAGDVPGFSAGSRFDDLEQVGLAFAEKFEMYRGTRGPAANIPVAKFTPTYPEERRLRGLDSREATARIEAVASTQAITASGGLCAPVAVDYTMMNVSTTDRPVRDSLAQFDAGRGGIRFIAPPRLTNLTSSVGVWTEANDTTPSAPTVKPCLTITCGSEVEDVVDAITQCLEVGNFSRRTFPEQFATWWALAAAAHSRLAERTILTAIGAGSTNVTTGQVLGAARDMLENVDQAGAAMRNRHRMAPTAPLRVILPAWLLPMMRADLTRELPGATAERLATADALIQSFFAVRNVNVTWALDGELGQDFGPQAAGALNPWILTVVWYMFPEGSWLFLDGGELNFGVNIVDSSLIETNDSRAFTETFEQASFRGVESLRISSTVCPDGSTSATVDVAPCVTGS